MHRCHSIFWAVGSPVGIIGGNNVGLRVWVVERRIDCVVADAIGYLGLPLR